MGEMERAYRHRVETARRVLFGAAFAFLAFSHFTFGPMFPPLIVAALACVGLGGWGARAMFPLAWNTFDALKPSPDLEDEARTLAKTLGVRIAGLRVSSAHDVRPRVRWSGRTAVVSKALQDLPPDQRRFMLARSLVSAPGGLGLFGQYGAWPTFYAWFAAWQFGVPTLAWAFAATLALWAAFTLVRLYRRHETSTSRALAATDDRAGALAYLRRERDEGSRRAERELRELGD